MLFCCGFNRQKRVSFDFIHVSFSFFSPLNVHRALYVNGFESEYDTVVNLIPPKGKTALNSDTRFWTVNHSVITAQYVATMITQIFTVSAINLDEKNDEESSILSIGLGGGNFDMFLHQKRPKVIDYFFPVL